LNLTPSPAKEKKMIVRGAEKGWLKKKPLPKVRKVSNITRKPKKTTIKQIRKKRKPMFRDQWGLNVRRTMMG